MTMRSTRIVAAVEESGHEAARAPPDLDRAKLAADWSAPLRVDRFEGC